MDLFANGVDFFFCQAREHGQAQTGVAEFRSMGTCVRGRSTGQVLEALEAVHRGRVMDVGIDATVFQIGL